MYAIAGVTGQTGGAAATALLRDGCEVLALIRDAGKAEEWRSRGAKVAVVSLDDQAALERALAGVSGFFTPLPEHPAAAHFHSDRRRMADAISAAIRGSGVPHVVFLSATSAFLADGNGPAKDLHYAEAALAQTGAAVTVIRASLFQENVVTALPLAKRDGIYLNFLPSADIAFPTIATQDIGDLVARCFKAGPQTEVIDLIGPAYSVRQMADTLGRAIHKELHVLDIPAAKQLDTLIKANVPPQFAQALAEMFACFASGRVSPNGQRIVSGTTQLGDVIARRLTTA